MSRRLFRILGAALCVVLSSALLSAPALAGKKRPAAAPVVSQPSAGEILCPATAVIGEPFVLRLKLARPAAKAELTFLGRSAPLALRKNGAGMDAAIILGADVLDGRPGRQDITVRVTPAPSTEGAKGGKALTLRAGVELVTIKRPVERLTLDPAMVNPPEGELPRIGRERAQTRRVLAQASAQRLWSLPFSRPAQGGLSSEYGIGRVLNGEPKSPHRGLDLEAERGDPVTAAADGVVALAGSFYYAGNCVYLDHGQGLLTMYFHLSEVHVAPGMRVARGQLLGLAGDTGRSTRSHLHFGVSALGRLVDPAPLFLYDVLPE